MNSEVSVFERGKPEQEIVLNRKFSMADAKSYSLKLCKVNDISGTVTINNCDPDKDYRRRKYTHKNKSMRDAREQKYWM